GHAVAGGKFGRHKGFPTPWSSKHMNAVIEHRRSSGAVTMTLRNEEILSYYDMSVASSEQALRERSDWIARHCSRPSWSSSTIKTVPMVPLRRGAGCPPEKRAGSTGGRAFDRPPLPLKRAPASPLSMHQ